MSILKGQMCLITKQCSAYEYEYTWIVDNRSQSVGLHFGLGHDRTRALFTFRPAFHMTSHPRSTLWTNSFAVGRRFCERIDLRPAAHSPSDICNKHKPPKTLFCVLFMRCTTLLPFAFSIQALALLLSETIEIERRESSADPKKPHNHLPIHPS